MSFANPEVRALRRQIRDWRDGRTEKNLRDELSDAYIAIFATLMLGAMGFNAIRQMRVEITSACTTSECADARNTMPWLIALGIIGISLMVARLFGPLLISPAEGAWLFAAPVDRRALLRPRLVVVAVFSLLIGILLGAVDATIAGFDVVPAVLFTTIIAAASFCMVMFAAVDQRHRGTVGRIATNAIALAIWVGLLLVAIRAVPNGVTLAPPAGSAALGINVILVCIAVVLLVRANAGLSRIRREMLAVGGSLLRNLSGAFASLDLNLAYDVMLSRRWRDKAVVRPVRGGPGGVWAIVWRDVIRLRRSLHTLIVLAAALIVPYVAATIGLGKAVTVIAALTGFLAGLGLCAGLRVLTRTPSLARCMPMSETSLRAAGLAVPAVILLGWGVATAPAVHASLATSSWAAAIGVGFTVGLTALTAVTRWITWKSPDYAAPLITSPAGAIPPSMFSTLFRGLDVVLLLTAPLLLAEPAVGVLISSLLAAVILSILLSRKPSDN